MDIACSETYNFDDVYLAPPIDLTRQHHIHSIEVSKDLGREEINELGRRGPYFKYVNFPIGITKELGLVAIVPDVSKFGGFDLYQHLASETAIYPEEQRITYPALGLCGESGEVAEKVKKLFRDDNGELSEERREALKKEIGDCFWYLAALAKDLDISLADAAHANLVKLFDRRDRGVLKGDGDNR